MQLNGGDTLVEQASSSIRPYQRGPRSTISTKGKLGLFDQDVDWVAHELGGDLKDVLCGGQENDLA